MSSVIEWKTASEIIEILKEQNAMVAGMSVAEAAAALGFTKTASGIYVKTIVSTTASAVTSTTATAAASGVTAGAATSASNLVLFESAAGGAAAGGASVGGLASLAVPVAITIAAAAGGYLIGKKIYEENEDFFDKLMSPVYDFFTGQNRADDLYMPDYTPTVPMIFDQDGNAFMDSRLKLSVKNLLDDLKESPNFNIITEGDYSNVTLPIVTKTFTGNEPYVEITHEPYLYFQIESSSAPVHLFYAAYGGDSYQVVLCSLKPFSSYIKDPIVSTGLTGSSRFSINGKEFYLNAQSTAHGGGTLNEGMPISPAQPVNTELGKIARFADLAYVILYGDSVTTGGLPEDVIKYTPGESQVSPITFPDEIPQWEPVALPDPPAVPGTMPAPKEFPDPAPDPEKITPYIPPIQPQPDNVPVKKPDPDFKPVTPVVPVPNPFPNTSTEPVPPPDPSKDPSQGLKPITPPVQVPTELPKPEDVGETPTPVLPVVPPITSSATGLLHVYNPTNSQINEFGSWLWTTFSGDLIETLSKLFNNPMDAVIGLHEIYCTPSTGEVSTIKAGFLDSGVASRLVDSRYVNISCGAIGVPEYWHNYLDYAPYTKSYCYLPFIGIVELNTDDIVGSGVEISYKIDTYNGSCIAIITTAKPGSSESITYQFSGNCAVEIPITSGMKSATQGALLGASVAGFAAATVAGGGGAVLGATATGGLRGASNSKNSVQHSGSFGSSYGAMGLKTPYLMIKRPKQKVVHGYNENYGYPAHKMVHVAKCSGYLKAIEVDVVSPTATEDEKKLIEQQLKSGIFVD